MSDSEPSKPSFPGEHFAFRVRGKAFCDAFVIHSKRDHSFTLQYRQGGADLVEDLIGAAFRNSRPGGQHAALSRPDSMLMLQKYELEEGGLKRAVLRGSEDYGFNKSRNTNQGARFPTPTESWLNARERVLVLFHQDADQPLTGNNGTHLASVEEMKQATHVVLQSYVPDKCLMELDSLVNKTTATTLITSANAMQRANMNVVLGSSHEDAAISVARAVRDARWHLAVRTVVVRLGMDGVLVVRNKSEKEQVEQGGAADKKTSRKVDFHYAFENCVSRDEVEKAHLVGFTSIATACYLKHLSKSRSVGRIFETTFAHEAIQRCVLHFHCGYGNGEHSETHENGFMHDWPVQLFAQDQLGAEVVVPTKDGDARIKLPGVACCTVDLDDFADRSHHWSLLQTNVAPQSDGRMSESARIYRSRATATSDGNEDGPEQTVREFLYAIVTQGQVRAAAERGIPIYRFGKLNAMDRGSVEGYLAVEALLRKYALEPAWRQPLSIGVFGAPGSGKSFGVKQIVESLRKQKLNFADKPSEYNVSQFGSLKDLANALHEARDVGLSGKIPLVFFDEFDSTFNEQQFGWLKYFLMPMQDGQFKDADSIYHTGRAVFIFAGGINHCFNEFRERVRNTSFCEAKGPDFIGRLRGFIDVAGLQHVDDDGSFGNDPWPRYARWIHSAILFRSTLENVWKLDADDEIKEYEPKLIMAFLKAHYRHGVRSMEAILQMGRFRSRKLMPWGLPTNAELDLHVSDPISFRRSAMKTPSQLR